MSLIENSEQEFESAGINIPKRLADDGLTEYH